MAFKSLGKPATDSEGFVRTIELRSRFRNEAHKRKLHRGLIQIAAMFVWHPVGKRERSADFEHLGKSTRNAATTPPARYGASSDIQLLGKFIVRPSLEPLFQLLNDFDCEQIVLVRWRASMRPTILHCATWRRNEAKVDA